MTYRPKKSSNKAAFLAVSCAALALLAFYLSAFLPSAVFYQIFAIVLAIVAVELYIKYIGADYVYEAGENDLNIYKITGKKSLCVCSLNYEESLTHILPMTADAEKDASLPKNKLAVNHCKNIAPAVYSVYYFNFNGKTARLKFEPDEAFTAYINQKIDAAFERARAEEEEES